MPHPGGHSATMRFFKRHSGDLPDLRDVPVDDVMRRWPGTLRVFLAFQMKCVGCPIGSFHSVEEACEEHGVELEVFLAALKDATSAGTSGRDDDGVSR